MLLFWKNTLRKQRKNLIQETNATLSCKNNSLLEKSTLCPFLWKNVLSLEKKKKQLNPHIRKNSTRSRQKKLNSLSLSSEKLNLLERRKMWTEHRLIQHVQMRTVRQHIHWTVRYFITRTRVAQERTGQDCTHCYLKNSLSSTRHVSFFATLDTDHQRKFSLSPASSVFGPFSPSQSCPLVLDPNILATIHAGVADPLKSHLPQVMSPKWSSPTTLSLEELSLTGILGQICIKPRQEFAGDDYQNPVTEDMEEFGQVGVEMPYIQSKIHSDHRRLGSWWWRLTKVLASPLYFHGRGKILILLEDPRLQGNQKQR